MSSVVISYSFKADYFDRKFFQAMPCHSSNMFINHYSKNMKGFSNDLSHSSSNLVFNVCETHNQVNESRIYKHNSIFFSPACISQFLVLVVTSSWDLWNHVLWSINDCNDLNRTAPPKKKKKTSVRFEYQDQLNPCGFNMLPLQKCISKTRST